MKQFACVIWQKPVPKGRPRFAGKYKSHCYTPKETKTAENEISYQYVLAQREYELKKRAPLCQPWEGPIDVHFVFGFIRPEKNRNRHHTVRVDIDNLIKTVCDALNGIAWVNDAQICNVTAEKVYAEKEGTLVVIRELCDIRNDSFGTKMQAPSAVKLEQLGGEIIQRFISEASECQEKTTHTIGVSKESS